MEWVLISIALTVAAAGGVPYLRGTGRRLALPGMTLVLAAVTAVVSILGNLNPDILAALGRDRDALLGGQWWRLITPLLVQDGGWAGTVFNLVALLIVGTLAETLYGRGVLLGVYVAAGIVSEIAGYTILQNQGFAGNSVADLGLTALCLVTYVVGTQPLPRVLGVVGLLAGATLIVTANLHGIGFAVGAVAGLVLALPSRERQPSTTLPAERPPRPATCSAPSRTDRSH